VKHQRTQYDIELRIRESTSMFAFLKSIPKRTFLDFLPVLAIISWDASIP
jgi:hypothetical protein